MPARLSSIQSSFQKSAGISHNTTLSVNPKTEKNPLPTGAHHLSPAHTSGVMNTCPGAGNCQKTCLHFAGNPAYMAGKINKRKRQTLAFATNNGLYVETLALAISRQVYKNNGERSAVRLNATSDIQWENVPFTLGSDSAYYIRSNYGLNVNAGFYDSILHFIRDNGLPVIAYDYTKIKRDWVKCRELGYFLTASYDGNDNSANHKICRDAIQNSVNVAVAFKLKKSQDLPTYIENFLGYDGRTFAVADGDLTDARYSDSQAGQIIGLRFKIPRGIPHINADILNFCYS